VLCSIPESGGARCEGFAELAYYLGIGRGRLRVGNALLRCIHCSNIAVSQVIAATEIPDELDEAPDLAPTEKQQLGLHCSCLDHVLTLRHVYFDSAVQGALMEGRLAWLAIFIIADGRHS
jgi:hypothetical protein